MAPIGKRSKLWDYFEELKPSLVMCTKCKKEIHIPYPKKLTRIFRAHLNEHGIFPDNDTRTLPDDLRQYYSELPGWKARCNDCGRTVSFLNRYYQLRSHLRRHSTGIYSRDKMFKMSSRKERSKLWNYFEVLEPSLAKCRKCKKEIHISCPTRTTRIFRAHLNEHVIFPDNLTLPDDLRQYYSELPGYKARCDCGQTVSSLDGKQKLRQHLKKHFTKTQSRDKAITMVPIGKRSKLWNYFEELKPSLVKCRRCKKEIHISCPTYTTRIFRAHLSEHVIFPDNLTLPDDLRQYYSELPGCKARCNDCGRTVSFLNRYDQLRSHLRRHSTRIQSRDKTFKMTSRKKRSKLWDYFEELKPSLVKCTNCKKEIYIRNPTSTIGIFREHLSEHRIFPDNDTHTLPDDLRQYYSELPGYEARCNDCGQTVSFLNRYDRLQIHLRRHSTRIQSRDETFKKASREKHSKLWDYFEEVEPSPIKCKKCKNEIHIRDPASTTRIFRAHLRGHAIFPNSDIHKLPDNLRQYYFKKTFHENTQSRDDASRQKVVSFGDGDPGERRSLRGCRAEGR